MAGSGSGRVPKKLMLLTPINACQVLFLYIAYQVWGHLGAGPRLGILEAQASVRLEAGCSNVPLVCLCVIAVCTCM